MQRTHTERALRAVDSTQPRLRDGLAITAFWACFALVTYASERFDAPWRALPPVPRLPGEVVNAGVWAMVTAGVFWLAFRFPLSPTSWMRRLVGLLMLGVLVANISDALSDAVRGAVFPLPADALRGLQLARPRWLGRDLSWLDDYGVYLASLAAAVARGAFQRAQAAREAARHREREIEARSLRLETDAVRLQQQLADARLDALRRQINPHFLFNTLHAVSALVERDPQGVRRMISLLSDLLRHSMDSATTPEIPVRVEFDLLERYLEIMQTRFDESLTTELHADPTVLDALVPNMLLQPLVENAIQHGAGERSHGGHVAVRADREGDELVLRVSDNGPGIGASARALCNRPATTPGQRVGLGHRTTVARLEQHYGGAQRFSLEMTPSGGTVAIVRMPFHTRPVAALSTAPACQSLPPRSSEHAQHGE